ncbi:sporulation integral membrane protein YlbJ [Paenibacillus sp. YYML68]|uniref:sporulation integral membrane protein YlbJ n=1 Tax=Paenibacillus sp. YYML68 TaxID=2909250 RepID=UPI0024931A73|nr:sporulation integral membrane protein YlbJ [Paenibacillus sp. YYML68]
MRMNPALPLAALTAALLAGLMLVFPQPSLEAAVKGIAIWWDVLFPALFPFFVISEMMLGIGIVHFFGTLLDPMMRPLFRVPGIGGFVMAMGFASGYPIGARLTSQLWDQRLVTREEGERLVAFTTSSDPIFLIGAVSVGFFHDVQLAVVLATAHYGSAILLGLLMRFHGGKHAASTQYQQKALSTRATAIDQKPIWQRAFEAMHEARLKDGRTLGVMLTQALSSALQLVFVIGGLVVFFSVVMEIMSSSGVMAIFYAAVQTMLQTVGIPPGLSEAVVNGFFEVTLGAKAAGSAAGLPLVYKAAIAAWVLSWAGLSVHAQIVSVLHSTPLRYGPFLAARIIHGLLAAVLVLVLWEPLAHTAARLEPLATLARIDMTESAETWLRFTWPSIGWTFSVCLAVMLAISSCILFIRACMNRLRT